MQPVDVEATRRACGLGPTDYNRLGGSRTDLSEECVRALGEDVGFDWEGLDREPRALLYSNDRDIPDAVMVGLYLLLSAPMPSIAEELSEAETPPVLMRALREVQKVNGFDDSLSASYLYYGVVVGRTRRMVFVDEPNESARFWYKSTRATIYVNLSQLNLSPLDVPRFTVHEAMHTWASHVRCSPTSNRGVPDTPPVADPMGPRVCDETTDGAWGAGFWYHYRASRTSACVEPYDASNCVWLADNEPSCRGKILDLSEFSPCDVSTIVYTDSRHCDWRRHLGVLDPYLPEDCAPYTGTRQLAP